MAGPSRSLEGGMSPTVVCTEQRIVEFVHGQTASDSEMLTFDPSAREWQALDVPPVEGVPAPIGASGLQDILLYSIGVADDAPVVTVDPVSGEVGESDLALGEFVTFIALTPSSALVFAQDGAISIAEVSA